MQTEQREWIELTLGQVEIEPVRERSWGSIWRVHASDGLYWFKAPHPSLSHEVPLRRILEAKAGEHVLPLVAADEAHGWQLTLDQGPSLLKRARQGNPELYFGLAQALAGIQRAVPVSELDGIGLERFVPRDAAKNLEEWGVWLTDLPPTHAAHLPTSELASAIRRVEEIAGRWPSDDGIGLSVDHNDLHAGNVFLGPLISDWGDAVISHPFCSMRRLAFEVLEEFDPALADEVTTAYLAEWGDPDELDELWESAVRITTPQRLMCWARLGDLDAIADYAEYITPLVSEAGLGLDELTTA